MSDSRYVPRGGNVSAATEEAIRSGIRQRVNTATNSAAIALTTEQEALFRDADGHLIDSPPSDQVERLLYPNLSVRGRVRIRRDPLSLVCPVPLDECARIVEGEDRNGDGHGHQDGHGEVLPADETPRPPALVPAKEVTTSADVPVLIDAVVEHMSSPESAVVLGLNGRAAPSDVRNGVKGFFLHSGPADAPALHDFHHLQIAFEHVWQELFDDGVLHKGKTLYTKLVELGIDPNEYFVSDGWEHLAAWLEEWKTGTGATPKEDLDEPPENVLRAFDISHEQWVALNETEQNALTERADHVINLLADFEAEEEKPDKKPEEYFLGVNTHWLLWKRELIRNARRQGERIIGYADRKLRMPQQFDQYHKMLQDLRKAMEQPYRFSVYAADRFNRSVNFGLITTYRQRWTPESYQVGELVKTVPLAPKESRRFLKKTSIRTNRAEKEVQNHLQSKQTESAETARAQTQIMQKATARTNFQLGAKGGVNLGIAQLSASTSFGGSAATESQEVKQEFREAVFKATEEYKSERMIEVNFGTAEDSNAEESGEISNPNDEIPVTYLFYDLQRRYRVSEHIHRQSPVVLIAQEFPKPSDITEEFVIANDWILRRVILDDSFVPAMNYIATRITGDEHQLQVQYENLQQLRRTHVETKEELVAIGERKGQRYAALEKSVEKRVNAIEADENEGWLEEAWETGWGGNDPSPEAMRVREDADRDAYEREGKLEKEMQARLERETTALSAATDAYTKNLSEHLNRKAQISRLLLHLKSNIMYYMQAIWSHEPPDQRFFRLHEVRVPKLTGKMTYKFEADEDGVPMAPEWKTPQKLVAHCELNSDLEYQTLAEVADLDNLLGFKGNYMMFPLKQPNMLVEFMMFPYVDSFFGLSDPDTHGNWTLSDFATYVCCLRKRLTEAEFNRLLPGLIEMYRRLVNAPRGDGETIVVPTDSLYIEALPGAHPILEDFKLAHREVDVKRAQAEVRGIELENIRAAARLLAGEREDPTIEKKVVIEGGSPVVMPQN